MWEPLYSLTGSQFAHLEKNAHPAGGFTVESELEDWRSEHPGKMMPPGMVRLHIAAFSLECELKAAKGEPVGSIVSGYWSWPDWAVRQVLNTALPTDPRSAQVYVIGFADHDTATDPVKIGATSRDVAQRLRELQTGNPRKLAILCSIPYSSGYESAVHAALAEHRLEGEWFAAHPDVYDPCAAVFLPGHEWPEPRG